MGRALQQLVSIMPPPAGPVEQVPWGEAVGVIGFELPLDYQEFVSAYGEGSIGGQLSVLAPLIPVGSFFDAASGISRLAQYTTLEIGKALIERRQARPESCPYPVFPESGGLLAWACNANSDHCFWLTDRGDPNNWPVVVWRRGRRASRAWRVYEEGMVDFLLRLWGGDDPFVEELLVIEGVVKDWVALER